MSIPTNSFLTKSLTAEELADRVKIADKEPLRGRLNAVLNRLDRAPVGAMTIRELQMVTQFVSPDAEDFNEPRDEVGLPSVWLSKCMEMIERFERLAEKCGV